MTSLDYLKISIDDTFGIQWDYVLLKHSPRQFFHQLNIECVIYEAIVAISHNAMLSRITTFPAHENLARYQLFHL